MFVELGKVKQVWLDGWRNPSKGWSMLDFPDVRADALQLFRAHLQERVLTRDLSVLLWPEREADDEPAAPTDQMVRMPRPVPPAPQPGAHARPRGKPKQVPPSPKKNKDVSAVAVAAAAAAASKPNAGTKKLQQKLAKQLKKKGKEAKERKLPAGEKKEKKQKEQKKKRPANSDGDVASRPAKRRKSEAAAAPAPEPADDFIALPKRNRVASLAKR